MTISSQKDPDRYDFVSIETKWQKHWLSEQTFKVDEDKALAF
jgi:leucyl-tRNA synthetase